MDDHSVRSISTATDPFGFLRNRQQRIQPKHIATATSEADKQRSIENSLAANFPIVASNAKENDPSYPSRGGNLYRTGSSHVKSRIFQNLTPAILSSPQDDSFLKYNLKQQHKLSRPPLRPAAFVTDTEHSSSNSVTLISITPPSKPVVQNNIHSESGAMPQTEATKDSNISHTIARNVDLIESFNKSSSSPIRKSSTRNYIGWDSVDREGHESMENRRGESMDRIENVNNGVAIAASTPNQKQDPMPHSQPSILSPLSELSHSPSTYDDYNSKRNNTVHRESPKHQHSVVSERTGNDYPNNNVPIFNQQTVHNRKSDNTTFTEDHTTKVLDYTTSSLVASPSTKTTVIQQPTTIISQSSSASVMTHVLHQKRLQHVAAELEQTQDELYRMQQEHQITTKKLDDSIQECNILRKQREHDIAMALRQAQEDHDTRMKHAQQRHELDWAEIQNTVVELEQEHVQQETELMQWQNELQSQQSIFDEQQRSMDQRRQEEYATYQRRIVGAEQRLEQQTVLLEQRIAQVQQDEELLEQQRKELCRDRKNYEDAVTEFVTEQKNYQEKYDSMEKEIEYMTRQRQDAENSLKQVIQQRQEYMKETEDMKVESKKNIQAVQDEIQISTTNLHKIQQEVADCHNELGTLKQRIRVLVEADQSSRQVTAVATAKADQNLTAILRQLEVAQRERDTILESIAKQREEYCHMQVQMSTEELRWKNEQKLLNQQLLEMESLRQSTQDEVQNMAQITEADIAARTKAMNEKIEQANNEIRRNTEQLENRKVKLNESIRQHESEVIALRHKENDFQKRCDELNQRLTDFGKVEHREQRLRNELERKVERLSNLIQTERTDHSNQLKSIDIKVKDMKQQHEQSIQSWTERYNALEAERDEKQMDTETLRQAIVDRDVTISLLRKETQHLREELSDVTTRFQQVEDREHHDLEKVQRFMEQLEAQASVLEQQEEKNAEERTRLQALEWDYQERVKGLDKQRCELLDGCTKRGQLLQNNSFIALLNQPWRQDQSDISISDAFSKWIRETLFQAIGEDNEGVRQQFLDIERHILTLQEQCNEAQQIRSEDEETLERERGAKRELQNQLRLHREKEQRLYDDIERLSREKQQELKRRRRESKNFAIGNNDADGDDLFVQREAEITRKEAFLVQMDLSIQDKERQVAEANDRIRIMATQLRKKESDLEAKEAWLISLQKSV
jgi:chromosome segregation ATPase